MSKYNPKCPVRVGPDVFSHLSIYSSIHLSIHQITHLSISLSAYLSIHLSNHLSMSLSIHLAINPSINPSIHPSIHLSIYLPIYLTKNSSVHLSIYPLIQLLYRIDTTWERMNFQKWHWNLYLHNSPNWSQRSRMAINGSSCKEPLDLWPLRKWRLFQPTAPSHRKTKNSTKVFERGCYMMRC